MRIVFLIIICIHGSIHMLGFVKAFGLYEIKELKQPVSHLFGILWLSAALLYIATAVMYGFRIHYWWIIGLPAMIISQCLILYFWNDARFGTIANVIVLLIAAESYASWNFENRFKKNVKEGMEQMKESEIEILTEDDLQHLPEAVSNYLKYVGALGRPKIVNFKAVFEAEMRNRNQSWFNLTVEQYDFFREYERLFFLKARMKGMPVQGYHQYKNEQASMVVKLFSIFPVVRAKGKEMFEAETVTLFNDMCFLAPATLIDKNIRWETVDSNSVKAVFSNQGIEISAFLYFNEKGQLVNFISDDRYDVNEMEKYRFSTPIGNYQEVNGYHIATYGEVIWHYPEGPFTYGKYTLKGIEYNISDE